MWHALDSKPVPVSIPVGHDRAKIWLAQDAIAGGDPQRALALIEPLALQNDPFVLHIQAAAFEQQGNFAGAVQKLVQLRDAYRLIQLGDKASVANDRADALAAYQAASEIDSNTGVMVLANFLAINIGDLTGADAVLEKALATYPFSLMRDAWYKSFGDNLRKQKHFDEAETVYKAALIEYPKDWAFYIGLGWVYYERGDGLQPAIDEFQKAIALDKTSGVGYYAVAQVLTRDQRFVEAHSWYRLALEHDPRNGQWIIGRGNNARDAGNLDLAMSLYQETALMFPGFSTAYYEMAYNYMINDQPEEAKTFIEKALALMNPPNEYYYVRAGQIFEWRRENGRALDAYNKALTINPANSLAQQGINRLGEP